MVDLQPGSEALVLFTAILVVGLMALLPAAYLALQGEIGVLELVVVAVLAMSTSDLGWYLVGRITPGTRLQNGRLAPIVRRVRDLAARFRCVRGRVLFWSRLIYGTRIPTCVACGMTRMPYVSFFAVNLASALAWLALLFGVAYVAGAATHQLVDDASRLRLVPLVLLAAAFGFQAILRARQSRRVRALERIDRERKVSVIVPARNEQGYLAEAIRSVRRQSIPAEVIVVENGSTDGTAAIARRWADHVVETAEPAGYSRARNLGAAVARGDLLVFLDADSRMAPDALAAILAEAPPRTFGTVLGRPFPARMRYRFFFFVKNLGHRLRFYKGVLGGLLFCDAELFRTIAGFDETMRIDELHDFSVRARRAGGRYRLVTTTWASTSMRRFEETGLARAFLFWVRLRCRVPLPIRFHAELDAYPRTFPGDPADLDAESVIGPPLPPRHATPRAAAVPRPLAAKIDADDR